MNTTAPCSEIIFSQHLITEHCKHSPSYHATLPQDAILENTDPITTNIALITQQTSTILSQTSLFSSCPPHHHDEVCSLIKNNTDSAIINATILPWHILAASTEDTDNINDL
jgi:hypothetical protein